MTGDETEWKSTKNSADAAYRKGDFQVAAQLYTSILENQNLSAEETNKLRGNRCLASQRLGDWKQAIEDAQATLTYDPVSVPAWFRFGISLASAKLYREAVAALEVALELQPGNAETKAKLKTTKAAMRALGHKQAGPTSDPEANKLIRQGIQQSLQIAKRALREKQRITGESSARTDNLSPRTPAMSPPRELRRDSSASATAMDTDSQEVQNEGRAEAANGSVHPSSSSRQEEDDAEKYKAKGTACYRANDWQGACSAYGEAIALRPDVAVYWGNRAAAQLMLGAYRSALEDSMKAVQLDPGFARGYQRAAKAFLTMGKLEQARQMYEAALKLDKSDTTASEGLKALTVVGSNLSAGAKALACGDPRTALWHADSALRASMPAVEPAQLLKVNALSALGRHPEALSESRSLTVEGSASHPEVLAIRAAALYAAGNMPLAERVYQEALRMDPDSAACRKGIKRLRCLNSAKEAGNAAFKQGRWADAHTHYSTAVQLDPDLKSSFMAQCYCNRAAAASKLGRHADARTDASTAVEYDPDFTKAYLRRGTAHSAMKDFEAAVRDFEKVKTLAPDTPGIASLLQQAKADLKKAKRVDLYKVLGVSASATQDDIKRAYKKMALKLHPDKASEAEREQAEAKFKQLTSAYALLSDPEKREKFDAGWSEEEIEQGGVGGSGPCSGADIDEIYAQLFSQMRGGGGFGGFGRGNGFHRYSSYQ